MSSIPGYKLEQFLAWLYDLIVDGDASANPSLEIAEALGAETRRISIPGTRFKVILDLYEPYREMIERRLLSFDEDNQSWRSYAEYVDMGVPKEVMEKALTLRERLKGYNQFCDDRR